MTSVQTSKLLQRLDETAFHTTFPDVPRVIFDQFSRKVSQELKQINQLFDEYTPHDDIHMASLLRIADDLLGDEVIGRLNGCEACILACAIYGHDWGMAVSRDEKERIVTGRLPAGRAEGDFALLPDEQVRWQRFARSIRIDAGSNRYVEEEPAVPKNDWREYVRQTHADRALARAIHYFENKGDLDKLGRPVGEVCAGHWYDIAQIRRLPTSWSVGGQSVNLRALAIYMRVIDLLDIGNNRTPFALWKFINPRNVVSAAEWKKHRAISPVTYRAGGGSSGGRVLQVHGETDDYRVFAALQDLKRYMEDQIRENVAALQELGDRSLGMLSVEWKVHPSGFEPIDIRFEFDRSSMFDLVSGEIYDGDPYVFIRELLQNAIDATELRRRRCEVDGLSLEDTVIRISVDHESNGDAAVTVTDRGTGMDLGIVRDYLAVVGRSYYRSREFEELETGMTPISRFGVGLLSCFEVADGISLKTRTSPNTDGLDVEIADRSWQFRVRKLSRDGPVGTSVTAWAKASKWQKGEFSDCRHLQVTDYVKAIAGFVPFPIHISEHGTQYVVCSALTTEGDLQALRANFPYAGIHRQPAPYRFKEAVVPQDVETASRILDPRTLRFSSNLDGVGIDGLIDSVAPTDDVLSSTRNVRGGHGSEYQLKGSAPTQLRWAINQSDRSGVSPSARCLPLSQVYFRGILLPDAKLEFQTPGGVPPSRVYVNVAGDSDDLVPLLSRRRLRNPLDVAREAVVEQMCAEISDRYIGIFCKASTVSRLLLLGRLARYMATPGSLLKCFPMGSIPVVLSSSTGALSVTEFDRLPAKIEVAPKYIFQTQKTTSGSYGWASNSIIDKKIVGAEQIVRTDCLMVVLNLGFEYDDGSPMEWNEADNCLSTAMRLKYHRTGARLALVNNQPYVIDTLDLGEEEEAASIRPPLHAHSIEFVPFDAECRLIVCCMRLQNDQLSHNLIRILMFNSRNQAAELLRRCIEAANDRLATLEPLVAGRIRDAFCDLPMVGFLHRYSPGLFEPKIARWVFDFCSAVADVGIINLTEEERACLWACASSPRSVIPCLE